MKQKTFTITISVKSPDEFYDLRSLPNAERYLEFGEYAEIKLEITEDFKIVSGEFLRVPVGG